MTTEISTPTMMNVQTENCNFKMKQLNHGLYQFHFSTNRQLKPVCTFGRILTAGKNKGQFKRIEAYYFHTMEKMEIYVTNKIDAINRRINDEKIAADKKAQAKKEVAGTLDMFIGTIFYSSWGYDQTNVDFFQIVGATKSSLKFRKIGMTSVPGSEGMMCDSVVPVDDDFLNDEIHTRLVRIYKNGSEYNVTMSYGHHSLSKYDKGASGVYRSWYA